MVSNILTNICYLFIVAFPLARARKYDLESESLKLYGEDIPAILRRFRRTPEYMKILQDQHMYLDIHLQEVAVQIMQRTENQLSQKVAEMVGYSPGTTTTTAAPSLIFNYKHIRRQGDEDMQDPVRRLDNYHMLHRTLNVHDRNHFRDLGYEMAGRMVHMIIKAMGPMREFSTTDNIVEIEGGPETTTEQDRVDVHHTHEVLSSTAYTLPDDGPSSTLQESFDALKRNRPSHLK